MLRQPQRSPFFHLLHCKRYFFFLILGQAQRVSMWIIPNPFWTTFSLRDLFSTYLANLESLRKRERRRESDNDFSYLEGFSLTYLTCGCGREVFFPRSPPITTLFFDDKTAERAIMRGKSHLPLGKTSFDFSIEVDAFWLKGNL